MLTNGKETDNSLTQFAARAHYEELLAAGVRVFEYQPTMMHAKTLVADGVRSSIGSMNFDNRSLALNSETSLLFLDEQVGADMDSLFSRGPATVRGTAPRTWTATSRRRAIS